MNRTERTAVCLPHDGLDGFGIALVIPLHIGQDPDPRFGAVPLDRRRVKLVGLLLQHGLAAAQFHLAAFEDVFRILHPTGQVLFFFFDLLYAFLPVADLGTDLLHAAALLFEVSLDAVYVLDAALDVRVQHRRFRLAGG